MLITTSVLSTAGKINENKISDRKMGEIGLHSSELVADAGGPYFGFKNDTIQFYGNASGGTPPYSWEWEFGDGHQDLAVVNSLDDTVLILMGNGDGTFESPISYYAGDKAWFVESADFNKDGALDLAVASYYVSIFIGNGDGTFGDPASYGTGKGISFLTIADFNNDGNLDIVTTHSADDDISILLGYGDGTFVFSGDYAVGDHPKFATSADFNEDGDQDLVVTNFADYSVSILLGNGDGTFAPAVDYAVDEGPSSVVAADFNEDGDLDIGVAITTQHAPPQPDISDVSILLGNGDGTFQSPMNSEAGRGPFSIVSSDFNEDEDIDLAVVNQGDDDVSILLGNGDGTFETPVHYGSGYYPQQIASADFNEDDHQDLVAAFYNTDVLVLFGNGDGTFGNTIYIDAGGSHSSVLTADFDGGVTLTEQNPEYQYADVGNYTVTLTVTDDDGNSDDAVTWAIVSYMPDLDCEGNLKWTGVKPGRTVKSNFKLSNIGEPLSLLDWEIESYPEWGSWSFDPQNGTDLGPGDDPVTVIVTVTAPDEKNSEFDGEIKIVNKEKPSDFCTINASLTTPKNKAFIFNFPLLNWLFERFPNAFPILRYMLIQ